MNYIEQQCRTLFWKIVLTRDRWCQLCGRTVTLETHHVFFKSQGNWQILYDPDYGVGLCSQDHKENPTAPHIDNELFFDKIIPRLPEERAQKILRYRNSVKKPQVITPMWKAIRAELKSQLKELEETVWMEP